MKADAPRAFNEQITIEHLLTHTAGVWEHGSNDPLRKNKDMTHRQLIGWTLEHMPLTAPPGERFAYSNFGYCILGRVIEKLTGQRYEQYIRDNILKRCGITGMQIAKNTLAERAANEVKYYGSYDPYKRDVVRLDFLRRLARDAQRSDELLRSYRRLQGYGPAAVRRYAPCDDDTERCEPALRQGPVHRSTRWTRQLVA